MPLYEYRCNACDHSFERIVKFSDPPLKTCPKCGKDAVHQVLHAPAVQFKGSGWYVSDYARKTGPAAATNKSAGTTDSASKESSSAKDSTPASGGTGSGSDSAPSGGAKSESK